MNRDIKVGEQYWRTLPSWIDGGRRVVVTVTRVLRDTDLVEALNGHDLEGTWTDSRGKAHRGKFYLGDLTEIPAIGEYLLSREV